MFPKKERVASGSVWEGKDVPHALGGALGRPRLCCFATRFLMALLIFPGHLREGDGSRDHEEAGPHFSSRDASGSFQTSSWGCSSPKPLR